MPLRALIVDDEYPARQEIRYHLSRHDNIHVVGEAASGEEALALMSALEYDIVFLDISFPADSGIDLGKAINQMERTPLIIYVTAYEKYAVDAFEVNATDYILKPIDSDKFDRSIARVKSIVEKRESQQVDHDLDQGEMPALEAKTGNGLGLVKKISAELGGKIHLVDAEEIYYAYIEDNYVFIKRQKDTLFTRYSMAALEERLDGFNFFRTNRSYLVNLNKVKEISPFFKGKCFLVMSDKEGSEVPVSRRQAKELKKIFDF